MIWPFNRKRKPTVVDRRSPNDFRPGDRVECIIARWQYPFPFDPELGDVLTVLRVWDAVNQDGVRAYWLTFKSTHGVGYSSQAFRKIVEVDDPAVIARIKSRPKATAL